MSKYRDSNSKWKSFQGEVNAGGFHVLLLLLYASDENSRGRHLHHFCADRMLTYLNPILLCGRGRCGVAFPAEHDVQKTACNALPLIHACTQILKISHQHRESSRFFVLRVVCDLCSSFVSHALLPQRHPALVDCEYPFCGVLAAATLGTVDSPSWHKSQ